MNFTREKCHIVEAVPFRIEFEIDPIPGISCEDRECLLTANVHRSGEGGKPVASGGVNYTGEGWKFFVTLGSGFADCKEGEYTITILRDCEPCFCLYAKLVAKCKLRSQSGEMAKYTEDKCCE